MEASEPSSLETEGSPRRRWAMSCYAATTVLLYADQNLMSPNLSAMAKEFGFTDLERDQKLGGDIALAFWMTGVPATMLFGCLADRHNRSVLFALTVWIGEGACFLTYFTTSYWQLYACRAITGFSLGGAMPVIYSVMGDLFQPNERHGVNALIAMGSGLGIALGQGLAGFLGPTFGWRLPFLVASLPALLLAALVLFSVQDPERGGMETAVLNQRSQERSNEEWASLPQGDDDEPYTQPQIELTSLEPRVKLEPGGVYAGSNNLMAEALPYRDASLPDEKSAKLFDDDSDLLYRTETHDTAFDKDHVATKIETPLDLIHSFCTLFSSPTVLLAIIQGVPGCIPWGIVGTYLNDFLSEDRGMSVEFATFILLWFGCGNFLGMLAGGGAGKHLYGKDPRYPALLSGLSAILACFPFWFLLNGVDSNTFVLIVVGTAFAAGMGSGVTGPIVKATLQNVTLPTMRGQAFALANTFDDFGRGLGPVFIAMLIKVTGGRTAAFNIGTFGWVLCGLLNLAIFTTVLQDEYRVQRTLIADMARDKRNDTQM